MYLIELVRSSRKIKQNYTVLVLAKIRLPVLRVSEITWETEQTCNSLLIKVKTDAGFR